MLDHVPSQPGGNGHEPGATNGHRTDRGVNGHEQQPGVDAAHGCTTAQLRRFIKSRSYVPMHELRRRFELNGAADDVAGVNTPDGRIYLGLPARESEMIGDLLRQGDIGVELCRDPRVPIAIGVYPTRPVAR